MTVGAITNLLVNRLKHPLLSAFHILMWSEKWFIIGRHILYLCPPKQFKYKSSLRVFWLPVCQCTGNIFPSFKVILLGHLSYMSSFCAFFSVSVSSGRIFAILSFQFLLPLPCHYVEGDTSVLTGTTSQRWFSYHRYTKRYTCDSQRWAQEPGGKTWGRKAGIWAHGRCSQQKDHRIICAGRAIKDYLVLTPLTQARNLPLRWTWQQRGKIPSQERNLCLWTQSPPSQKRGRLALEGHGKVTSTKHKAKRKTVKNQ